MTPINTSLSTLTQTQKPAAPKSASMTTSAVEPKSPLETKSTPESKSESAPISPLVAPTTAPGIAMPKPVDAEDKTKVSSATTQKKSSKDGDVTNPKGILGKDDFLKLLLTELQYQDPTEPMDTEKILAQTSQLATLESSNNTNKSLANLAKSFTNSQQFSTISAIGKIADLGDDTIIAEGKGKPIDFDMYIPSHALNGTVSISDSSGNMVDTINIGDNPKGVYQFTWNGKDSKGNMADAGTYHVSATYLDSDNQTRSTRVGTYPIDSVKFDGETTLLGVGSSYVPLSKVVEVY